MEFIAYLLYDYIMVRPTAHHRESLQVRQSIHDLQREGEPDFAWWDPLQDSTLTGACIRRLEECLDHWAALDNPNEVEFHNRFFAVLFDLGIPEFKAARIFIHWIETGFYDYIERIDDFDVRAILEHAHLSFLDDLHIFGLRARMKQLQRRWQCLQEGEPNLPTPPVPDSVPRAARAYEITSTFQSMGQREQDRHGWRLQRPRPRPAPLPPYGPFFVIHLYSGRRRENDFHMHMQQFLNSAPAIASVVYVISIDTAIDPCMNVHSRPLWTFLLGAARQARILGMLLGPPCETWSEARFSPLMDEHGSATRGPRPLRSATTPWGLCQLSRAELEQVHIGNCLLLRGIWLSIPIVMTGGCILLEHPAPPYDLERPSIWRTQVVLMLLRHGGPFRRHTFRQGHYGAAGRKPTTIMHANCPIIDILNRSAMPAPASGYDELIGRDLEGKFKTSRAKEYPALLCRCFAEAIWCNVSSRANMVAAGPVDTFAQELVTISGRVDLTKEMMADYQPMR